MDNCNTACLLAFSLEVPPGCLGSSEGRKLAINWAEQKVRKYFLGEVMHKRSPDEVEVGAGEMVSVLQARTSVLNWTS